MRGHRSGPLRALRARATRAGRATRAATAALAATALLAGCATVVSGTPSLEIAPNARLAVVGDSGDAFDTTVKNALSDVTTFWKGQYPKVADGKALPKLKGGFYSIDGAQVFRTGRISGPAARNGCLKDEPTAIVDNAFFCQVDDSIAWDRADKHLIPALAQNAGDAGNLLIGLAFAHEFGHAVQYRLGILDKDLPTIATESQADCAAGAWLAAVKNNQAAHFRTTPQQLDKALNAYLLVRDQTPVGSSDGSSHGNGFDRLSALNEGLTRGATYCFDPSYFNRQYTERPFVTENDYLNNGNECLEQVLNPGPPPTTTGCVGGGGLQPDLNAFWAAAAKSFGRTWKPVTITEAPNPKCGSVSKVSQFGYCPDDNTVYYSRDFAKQAYYSLESKEIDRRTAEVRILENQPADYALGTLFAMGWGLAVRDQLFGRSTDDQAALLAAACYTGAYSKAINVQTRADGGGFILSPPDMDEATSAMINLVGRDEAFGARGTTALQRIQAFVKGYNGGKSGC